jgi:hypothetical protein
MRYRVAIELPGSVPEVANFNVLRHIHVLPSGAQKPPVIIR